MEYIGRDKLIQDDLVEMTESYVTDVQRHVNDNGPTPDDVSKAHHVWKTAVVNLATNIFVKGAVNRVDGTSHVKEPLTASYCLVYAQDFVNDSVRWQHALDEKVTTILKDLK